ncbi:MAG: SatD family protein [Anaerolineaceae bacterium]|nr:SatD family protein [Anaerolineaceae bacterium]
MNSAAQSKSGTEKGYFAVIGDLVNSKSISSRGDFQKYFSDLIERVNRSFVGCIASRFTITTGDELQGLLHDASQLSHLMDTIITNLHPVKVRFGISYGHLNTSFNPHLSVGADGPVYWAARQAIQYIHNNNDYGTSRIFVTLPDGTAPQLINSALAANGFMLDGWRDTQFAVLKGLIDSGLYSPEFEQIKLAEFMKLTPASLQKRIKGSGVKIYLRNGASISQAINDLKKMA